MLAVPLDRARYRLPRQLVRCPVRIGVHVEHVGLVLVLEKPNFCWVLLHAPGGSVYLQLVDDLRRAHAAHDVRHRKLDGGPVDGQVQPGACSLSESRCLLLFQVVVDVAPPLARCLDYRCRCSLGVVLQARQPDQVFGMLWVGFPFEALGRPSDDAPKMLSFGNLTAECWRPDARQHLRVEVLGQHAVDLVQRRGRASRQEVVAVARRGVLETVGVEHHRHDHDLLCTLLLHRVGHLVAPALAGFPSTIHGLQGAPSDAWRCNASRGDDDDPTRSSRMEERHAYVMSSDQVVVLSLGVHPRRRHAHDDPRRFDRWGGLRHVFSVVRVHLRGHHPGSHGVLVLGCLLLVVQPLRIDDLEPLLSCLGQWDRLHDLQPLHVVELACPAFEDLLLVQHLAALRTVVLSIPVHDLLLPVAGSSWDRRQVQFLRNPLDDFQLVLVQRRHPCHNTLPLP